MTEPGTAEVGGGRSAAGPLLSRGPVPTPGWGGAAGKWCEPATASPAGDVCLWPIKNETNSKGKNLCARSLSGRHAPSRVTISQLPKFASHRRSSETAARARRPASLPGPSSPRFSAPGTRTAALQARGRRRGPGSRGWPATRDARDDTPAHPPPRPQPPVALGSVRRGARTAAPSANPPPEPQAHGGCCLPARPPRRVPRSRVLSLSPPSQSHCHLGESSSPLVGATWAEPGLRPPRPLPRPHGAARPPPPPYLVVVVGVPLLQEGGGRRLVLLLELRADRRPAAGRLLRRRGRWGLLLR